MTPDEFEKRSRELFERLAGDLHNRQHIAEELRDLVERCIQTKSHDLERQVLEAKADQQRRWEELNDRADKLLRSRETELTEATTREVSEAKKDVEKRLSQLMWLGGTATTVFTALFLFFGLKADSAVKDQLKTTSEEATKKFSGELSGLSAGYRDRVSKFVEKSEKELSFAEGKTKENKDRLEAQNKLLTSLGAQLDDFNKNLTLATSERMLTLDQKVSAMQTKILEDFSAATGQGKAAIQASVKEAMAAEREYVRLNVDLLDVSRSPQEEAYQRLFANIARLSPAEQTRLFAALARAPQLPAAVGAGIADLYTHLPPVADPSVAYENEKTYVGLRFNIPAVVSQLKQDLMPNAQPSTLQHALGMLEEYRKLESDREGFAGLRGGKKSALQPFCGPLLTVAEGPDRTITFRTLHLLLDSRLDDPQMVRVVTTAMSALSQDDAFVPQVAALMQELPAGRDDYLEYLLFYKVAIAKPAILEATAKYVIRVIPRRTLTKNIKAKLDQAPPALREHSTIKPLYEAFAATEPFRNDGRSALVKFNDSSNKLDVVIDKDEDLHITAMNLSGSTMLIKFCKGKEGAGEGAEASVSMDAIFDKNWGVAKDTITLGGANYRVALELAELTGEPTLGVYLLKVKTPAKDPAKQI